MDKKDGESLKILRSKRLGYGDSDKSFENTLKTFDNQRQANIDIYHLGEEWFNAGFSLEDADRKLQENFNFINGYRRCERLAYIKGLNDRKKKR